MENKINSVYKKLHAIMSEVDYIQKDKKNDFHKYNYASEQAIKQTLHPLLVKHNVLFSLAVDKVEMIGGLTIANCTYNFIDIETGDVLEGTFVGQGEDKGDKGIWKAITGVIKYIMTSTFLIPTGDDPENDTEKPAKSKTEPTIPFTSKPAPEAIQTLTELSESFIADLSLVNTNEEYTKILEQIKKAKDKLSDYEYREIVKEANVTVKRIKEQPKSGVPQFPINKK